MPVARADLAVPLALGVLARGESLWVREASPSMVPLIRPGDELLLAPLDSRAIPRGALIACARGGHLVIHRVVAASGSGVVTKGDALASPDPLVPWERVVARVVALRGPDGRVVDLKAFPWPLVNCLLGWVAAIGGRLSPETGGRARLPLARRVLWKAFRLPFYLARLVLR